MVKIHITDTKGTTRQINANKGISLMEAIRENDFDDLAAICGGCCSCATCHIFVKSGPTTALPSMLDDEEYLLEDADSFQAGTSRLSCQIEISDALEGLAITIAPLS